MQSRLPKKRSRLHRGEASKLFKIIIVTLFFLGVLQATTFYTNAYNQKIQILLRS